MPQPGTTSDLYLEPDNPGSTLGQPPAPPSSVPPPTKPMEKVVATTKPRMADEHPDGSVRDTSTEALRAGNDLGFRNISDEEQAKPQETKQAETPKPNEAPPAPPPEPKLYAGKFKTPEELEKGYEEAQKLITRQGQEKAQLAQQVAQKPPEPVAKTPEQLALEQAQNTKLINEFVADPKTFIQEKIVNQTIVALSAQQVRNDWVKNNPDLAEHEFFVAAEATRLMQADPEIAKDPARLMKTATDNFRQIVGKLRTDGAKEALTQETRTIPLLSGTTPGATEQPREKAPLTADEAYQSHLQFLKEQEKKSHRGLRR
jgi:hypothetical protein